MASSPKDDPAALPFEAHLEALEAIVSDLESDALPLEASIERYRKGVDHLAACRRILDGAEKRLAELVARADGTGADERPLAVGADGLEDAGPAAESRPAKSSPRSARKSGPASSAPLGGDIPH